MTEMIERVKLLIKTWQAEPPMPPGWDEAYFAYYRGKRDAAEELLEVLE